MTTMASPGHPVMATASFDVTALRLEIKGYVVNDGHEGDHEDPDLDQIVRGDEAIAGVELELLTIKKVSTNKKDTTFTSHGTTETDDDGSYSFDDVVERQRLLRQSHQYGRILRRRGKCQGWLLPEGCGRPSIRPWKRATSSCRTGITTPARHMNTSVDGVKREGDG